MLGTHWKGRKCGNPLRGTCLKGMLEYVTPSEARGLGWWVQAAMEEPPAPDSSSLRSSE